MLQSKQALLTARYTDFRLFTSELDELLGLPIGTELELSDINFHSERTSCGGTASTICKARYRAIRNWKPQ